MHKCKCALAVSVAVSVAVSLSLQWGLDIMYLSLLSLCLRFLIRQLSLTPHAFRRACTADEGVCKCVCPAWQNGGVCVSDSGLEVD